MRRKFAAIAVSALAVAVVVLVSDPMKFYPVSIRGKRVLITGASSGIGEELAYQYSQLGASVFLTGLPDHLLKKVAEKCRQHGAERVEYSEADMAVVRDRDRLVDEVRERFDGRLDHLVLNHATSNKAVWSGSARNMSDLRRDLEVNFVSFVDVASKLLPMLTESRGNIGVVSSMTGKIGTPLYASYSADKAALLGFFPALRQELMARKVDVSITMFVLGYVATETAMKSVEKMRKASGSAYLSEPAPVNDTAAVIIKGIAKRAYEIQYPSATRFVIFLHKIAPVYVENFIGKQMAKLHTYS